jgi:hypothetical protein
MESVIMAEKVFVHAYVWVCLLFLPWEVLWGVTYHVST